MAELSPSGNRDLWLPATGKAKGVVLVAHGLNLHPERMDDLGRALSAQGFEVFRPAFHGHAAESDDLLWVEPSHWEQDALRFHSLVTKRAAELGVPRQLLAYSFSALVFQSMADALPFDRRVYIAPALATHSWYHWLLPLVSLFPGFTYRTMIPERYYANERGGFRTLLAFHVFLRRWRKWVRLGKRDSVPTLLWIDPADELVHARRLQKLVRRQPEWSLRALSTDGCTLPKRYHHLAIDKASLGTAEFARLVAETLRFLEAAQASSL